MKQELSKMSETNIQEWLIYKISRLSGKPLDEVDVAKPFAEYGLDSVHAVGLSGDIENWLGISIDATVTWDYPTIEAMSKYLIAEISNQIKNDEFSECQIKVL